MLGGKLCSMPAMPGAKLGEQGGTMVGYDDDEDTMYSRKKTLWHESVVIGVFLLYCLS
ncbi:hypothetical protein BGW80DRAFT_1354335 [Lactifluus volemus]|nr:hypothetical protein BGW80DRAFT_1354335 [Lactifluus volemus]